MTEKLTTPGLPYQHQRAQVTLSALMLISCLMMLAFGSFQAAKASLQSDVALFRGALFQQYRLNATHHMRLTFEPGDFEWTMGQEEMEGKWLQLRQEFLKLDWITVAPVTQYSRPTVSSLWISSTNLQMEIRGETYPNDALP